MPFLPQLLCFVLAALHVCADTKVQVSANVSVSTSSFPFPGGLYELTENIVGDGFYDRFTWENISDPTHGRVTYVDQQTSINQNLTFASSNTFILRTDNKAVLDASGPGRNSARIITKNEYTTHVAVFDVRHMPQGCGTWPAIWSTQVGNQWPDGGEIDIVEGVNDQSPNAATLHTLAGCTMPETRPQLGTPGQNDCDWTVNYNTGCGVKFPTELSYGPNFNENGGGWFVLERTTQHIKVWFWPRDSPLVPLEIRFGTPVVSTIGWGLPSAYFPNTQCNIEKYFGPHHIIINLTLCGDWAGNKDVYAQSGCSGTCVDHVNSDPEAFTDAFFDFAAVRIYEPKF